MFLLLIPLQFWHNLRSEIVFSHRAALDDIFVKLMQLLRGKGVALEPRFMIQCLQMAPQIAQGVS